MLAGAIIQHDPWLFCYIEQRVNTLLGSWYACKFDAEIDSIDLLGGCITFKDIKAEDYKGSWFWYSKKASLKWSWHDFLQGRKCSLTSDFSDLYCFSEAYIRDGVLWCAIEPHFVLMGAPPEIDVPFNFSGLHINKSHLELFLPQEQVRCKIDLSGVLDVASDMLHGKVIVQNGSCTYNNQEFMQAIEGKCEFSLPFESNMHVMGDVSCMVPSAPNILQTLILHGRYSTNRGWDCLLENKTKDFQITAKPSLYQIIGTCNIFGLAHPIELGWNYDYHTHSLNAQSTAFSFPDYDIKNGIFSMHANANTFTMLVETEDKKCTLSGTPFPLMLQKGEYQENGNKLISCSGTYQCLDVIISYGFLHKFAEYAGIDLQGDGILQAKATCTNTGINLHCNVRDAHIRIPLTYNIIQNIAADVHTDFVKRTIIVKNLKSNFYKGTVISPQITLLFDKQGAFQCGHCPILFQKCFIGWKKDFFAQFSGALMALIEPSYSSLEGNIVVDQAHIRGNLLSAEFQQEFFGGALQSLAVTSPPVAGVSGNSFMDTMALNISFQTKKALEVKTPFLEAWVQGTGNIEGTLMNPRITGVLSFERGTLGFLYKPLFITRGKITLRPEAPDDPLLDIVARNQIKKYEVELAITGSARNPKITFSTLPHLEQAQIITLLLGGSDDGSLYFLMPQVLTETLERLLFGSAEITSSIQKYLGMLFKPLKRISIVPKLSDQSGHGGLRGALEIEVNDRLRAALEKNLTFPEDTTFEVEYDISDDTQIRAMQDERGDLGFEGEMRWKF
jgi:hypothetical protein